MASTTISYSSSGYNGLMDWLGKDKGTTTWAHPETTRAHVVSKHFSEFNSSYGSENVFSQSSSTVWHSNTAAEWVATTQELRFDFGDGLIVPTHFAMQGRSVNATDGPSAFTLLGSIDGAEWVTLLEASSVTWTTSGWNDWAISDASGDGYRFFELIITGLSEAGNGYYSIGEIEFYGSYSDGNATLVSQDTYRPLVKEGWNGLIDYIGCSGRNIVNAFTSPAGVDVTATASSNYVSSYPASNALQQTPTWNFSTNNTANSWWHLDLGSGEAWALTHFAWQVASSVYPYRWELRGSNLATPDEATPGDWTVLIDGDAVPSMGAIYDWHSWAVADSTAYRHFLLINVGKNNDDSSDWMQTKAIEFYGSTDGTIPGEGGGGAGSYEYGDSLLKYLQDQGATSKEIVGALNELNATSGVEFQQAYDTYFSS